ncbi:DUF3180 domain-containing protein [Actinobacteria bacterium YIM 96077]|uniref:DUF3180 domain-containing protein n=1 Tax=Phytoactinopolyspora halophila TaxID=1981511 RepID=A0A329R0R5_9ACTN|nr:DUF3180 domain-containing protein [Phytoactinopolyspora halophila]AYY11392.1 DUF3180 domain-containing protein [Actinobacteria bacterium YIM 96077]RAW18127.1 hypothetical protein DPM12_04700 [Phytoactinopolyspora halophila]
MHKTRIATLVWTGLLAGPAGWLIARIVHESTGLLPPVPLILPLFLVIFAALMFAGARMVQGWIHHRRHDRHMSPLRIARALAVAKAAELFGAALAGGYVGLAVVALDHFAAPMGREGMLMSALTAGAAVLATVAAVVLERSCLVPPEDEEERAGR